MVSLSMRKKGRSGGAPQDVLSSGQQKARDGSLSLLARAGVEYSV